MPTTITSLPPGTVPASHYDEAEKHVSDAPEAKFAELWQDKKKGFTFYDFLDIINPLQHIPLISTIYRELTGDQIGTAPRIIGGALFGGPFGLVNAALTAAVEQASGNGVGGHLLAALQGEVDPVETAQKTPPPQLAVIPDAAPKTPARAQPAPSPAAPAHTPAHTPAPAAAIAPQAAAKLPTSPAYISRPTQLARPSPFAPAPAVPGQQSPAQQAAAKPVAPSGPSSERARIEAKVLQMQKAQANILLASIMGGQSHRGEDDRAGRRSAESREPADPFRQLPGFIPSGASPQMIGRAMGNALDKYQETYRLRGTGVALPPPGR